MTTPDTTPDTTLEPVTPNVDNNGGLWTYRAHPVLLVGSTVQLPSESTPEPPAADGPSEATTILVMDALAELEPISGSKLFEKLWRDRPDLHSTLRLGDVRAVLTQGEVQGLVRRTGSKRGTRWHLA